MEVKVNGIQRKCIAALGLPTGRMPECPLLMCTGCFFFIFLTVKVQSNPIMSQSINFYKYGADKAIRLASTLSS